MLAGAVGIALVLIYMIFYYRVLGLVVLAGLAVSGALLYCILAQLSQSNGLALSLAGVTGIIVSVGVTVDSYVVYFERLKDEVRSGRSVRMSVDHGFARAYRTILTADFVSFAAAAILYVLTIGSVRGFAFTLGLSTILDVIIAYTFIRPFVILLGRNRRITEALIWVWLAAWASGPSRCPSGRGAGMTAPSTVPAPKLNLWQRVNREETRFDFAGRWKQWLAVSAIIIVVGLGIPLHPRPQLQH